MTWKLWMANRDVLLTVLTQHLLRDWDIRENLSQYHTKLHDKHCTECRKKRYLFSKMFLAILHISLMLMLIYCIQKLTDANLIILKIIHCTDSQLILENIRQQKLYSLMRSVFPATDHNFTEPLTKCKPTNVHNSSQSQ